MNERPVLKLKAGAEMLTWMLYVVLITLCLSGAALAAERAARLRRAGSRWIWGATIVASLVVPTVIASVSIQVPSLSTPTVAPKPIRLRELTSVHLVPLTWVQAHTSNVVAVHRENKVLQRTWIAVSAALLTALVLNGLQLLWRKRRWRSGTVAGVPVYIAEKAGPAVVGLLRPRIVVPEWLLKASSSRQLMVITHEQSHLKAHDPQLLTAALVLLVLMPWNLPLWWQLHRLRYAIEVDCDNRVLKAGLDTGQYGETLIEVSQRPHAYIGSVAAMSESRSFLEDRIKIMVRDPVRWGSVAVVTLGCVTLALVAVAAQITPPNFGSSEPPALRAPPDALDEYVGFYVRGASEVGSVVREGSHLVMSVPGCTSEITPASATSFVWRAAAAPASDHSSPRVYTGRGTLVRNASGQVSELIIHYGGAAAFFSIPWTRVDAPTAKTIMINNDLRSHSQAPVHGSDVALRRLIEGLRTRKPDYDEMAPWFAELVKETAQFNEEYVRRGAVESIEFSYVDLVGGDVYVVHQQGGFSRWTIWLGADGRIADADNNSG